jgi:hypothetical protein
MCLIHSCMYDPTAPLSMSIARVANQSIYCTLSAVYYCRTRAAGSTPNLYTVTEFVIHNFQAFTAGAHTLSFGPIAPIQPGAAGVYWQVGLSFITRTSGNLHDVIYKSTNAVTTTNPWAAAPSNIGTCYSSCT